MVLDDSFYGLSSNPKVMETRLLDRIVSCLAAPRSPRGPSGDIFLVVLSQDVIRKHDTQSDYHCMTSVWLSWILRFYSIAIFLLHMHSQHNQRKLSLFYQTDFQSKVQNVNETMDGLLDWSALWTWFLVTWICVFFWADWFTALYSVATVFILVITCHLCTLNWRCVQPWFIVAPAVMATPFIWNCTQHLCVSNELWLAIWTLPYPF